MIGLVIIVFLAFIYVELPIWIQFIVLWINFFMPDTIPVLDEVFMIVTIINKLRKLGQWMLIIEWIRRHKLLTIGIAIGVVLLVVNLFQVLIA